VKGFTAAFPDQHYEFQDIIAEGDKVVIGGIYSGTHKGEFMGQPPTGKRFSIVEIDIFRIEDDKVVEHWDAADTASMARQLGLNYPGGP
jgi:predicted ester cyclase